MPKLRVALEFAHSLLMGGQTGAILIDITTAREPSGVPMIPASALKGSLRVAFERLLGGLGEPVCHLSHPDQACPPNSRCLCCQLFGAPGWNGILRFQNARLNETLRPLFTKRASDDQMEVPSGLGYSLRPGVAINRGRKVAEDAFLYTAEIVSGMPRDDTTVPLMFMADIEILGSLPEPDRYLLLLQVAAQNLTALGASKSQGLGRVDVSLEYLADDESHNSPIS